MTFKLNQERSSEFLHQGAWILSLKGYSASLRISDSKHIQEKSKQFWPYGARDCCWSWVKTKYLETLQCGRSPPRPYAFEFISSPQGSPTGGQRDETRLLQSLLLVFHLSPLCYFLSSLFCPSCCSFRFEVLINLHIRLVLLLNHFNLCR